MTSEAVPLVPGSAVGIALVLEEPLSFWGGFDALTGELIDRHHPQSGEILTDRVLTMPYGRGSSSASAVLAEAIRLGTAPAAILLREPDPIVMLGAMVAQELYGLTTPVVAIPSATYERITTGDRVEVAVDGSIRLTSEG